MTKQAVCVVFCLVLIAWLCVGGGVNKMMKVLESSGVMREPAAGLKAPVVVPDKG